MMYRYLALVSACLATSCGAHVDTHDIYLVRHAEKATGDDPGLTPVGEARAQALVERLAYERVTHVHSTDTRRTRLTAGPMAAARGLAVGIYDAGDLDAVAQGLTAEPGGHLVVGHSNTTPQLAEALGCGPQEPMPETEYDRITTVRVGTGGTVKCVVARYGE